MNLFPSLSLHHLRRQVDRRRQAYRRNLGAYLWPLLLLILAACAPSAVAPATPGASQALPTRESARPAAQATPSRAPGCTVVSRKPTPNPTVESLLPPPGEKDWVRGPKDATVTIIDYSDFQ